jgi:hypothetical protein
MCPFGIGAAIAPTSNDARQEISTSPHAAEPAFHRPVIELV